MKKFLLLATICLMLLPACSTGNGSNLPDTKQEALVDEETETGKENETKNEQLLLDDDYVKVSYIEVFEEPSVDGVFYFRLQVENKTEKAVTIYLLDPTVNNVSTLALSGVPMEIQPEGKSLTPFFFSYSNLDISSIDDLEDISFSVKVEDNEDFSEIEVSDRVSVPF